MLACCYSPKITNRTPSPSPSPGRRGLSTDSDSYASAVLTPAAHGAALKAATAIAVVGARVIMDENFRKETRASWAKEMKAINAEDTIRSVDRLLSQYPSKPVLDSSRTVDGSSIPSSC